MPLFPLTPRDLQRLRQIANVFIKHGFGFLVGSLNLQRYLSLGKRVLTLKRRSESLKESKHSIAERGRMVLEELGPTFIKLGQILSTRSDIIPADFLREFSKLQDEVPPFSFSEVKKVIEEQFGLPLEQLFSYFEEDPLAAASIAQVHQASLPQGREVIVKVQRPGIVSKVKADLDILLFLAHLAERHIPRSRLYSPVEIAEEFAATLRRELDFTVEANHTDRFYRNFEEDNTVRIPQVYWDLTGKRVLTLERIKGIKISDLEALDKAGLDKKKIALQGVNVFLKQIFEHGFFHADPHPGNLLVLDNEVIGLVDFGIIGRLDKETLRSITNMLISLASHDLDRLGEEFLNLGLSPKELDRRSFKADLLEFVDSYFGVPLKHIQAESFIYDMIHLAGKHGIRVPRNFVLLGKTVFIIGGIGRELDPDFDFLEVAKPFAYNLIKKRLHPQKLFLNSFRALSEISSLLESFPGQANRILKKFRQGEFKLTIEHKGLEDAIQGRDKASNRLSLSLIIASLIAGSSLLIRSEGVLFWGGVFGFSLAGFFGVWLVIAIWRSGL
ncbi:MAG: AarF/ABC1/UbiB kinase family protein [Nitrospirae bacterium]|nr:AarF/ABC1/UbiB kinase family protein [Nitrospirota bacterium]